MSLILLHRSPIKSASGFSLVELAIVMMVISLLIAALLKGVEMVENARVGRQIAQVNMYEAALGTFKTSYGTLPGDLNDPDARLRNCSTGNFCLSTVRGNGNGLIEPREADIDLGNWTLTDERNYIYPHLSAAGLMPFDSNLLGSGDTADDFPLGILPGSSIRISHISAAAAGVYPKLEGLYIFVARLRNGTVSSSVSVSQFPAMSANNALQIDRKIDDGFSGTGNVLGVNTATAGANCRVNNDYNEAVERDTCNIGYRTRF